MSGRRSRAITSASAPFSAQRTAWPASVSRFTSIRAWILLSSATSTSTPAAVPGASVAKGCLPAVR